MTKGRLKGYRFPIILLISIMIGSTIGYFMREKAEVLRPLGDIFINMMFVVVVPLVFFSISSVIANMEQLRRFGKVIGSTLVIFIVTGFIASVVMLIGVKLFPPAEGVDVQLETGIEAEEVSLGDQIVQMVTASDFILIFSKESMLALIFFSVLVGIATSLSKEKGEVFAKFLQSGSEVFMKIVSIVMYYAPIGLGAYFATLVGVFGQELLSSYLRSILIYYPVAVLYFFIGFTVYAYIAGRKKGVVTFWKNILAPAATALGTGSSVASIPSNLEAAKKAGVPKDIRETVIPIGATLHMEGSCLAAILKIAFLFGLFNMEFSGIGTFATAIGISILAGTVVSGIPSGGMIGEMMIVMSYSFPVEALPILATLGFVVDPPATMVNVTGDNATSMLVARKLEGKNWMEKSVETV